MVKELVELGHVEVVGDAGDRRRRPVRLTPRGREAVEAARAARRDVDQRIRQRLGDAAFDHTMRGLLGALDALGLTDRVQRRAAPPPTLE
jgi:DNA-binding MarR family transcriptional regulator